MGIDQLPSIPDGGDPELAQRCLDCPLCREARNNQRGIAHWVVKHVQRHFCPNCKAYERVFGCKAHEPVNPDSLDR